MTNQTLAQDPAEFRRKFKGLRQLYLRSHAVYSPGGTRAVSVFTISGYFVSVP